MTRVFTRAALLGVLAPFTATALPSFPGAEGFGAVATGGRGGQVITVTTLDPTGPGSLQEALDTPGPRIVVFAVSGIIETRPRNGSKIVISHGDLTIAGQTASALGRGITIHGHLYATDDGTDNIIIRHVRVRPPEDIQVEGDPWWGYQHYGIRLRHANRVILDHVDVSYVAREQIDFGGSARDVTVQWSTLSFSRLSSPGAIWPGEGLSNGPGGGRFSVHHNLFAHIQHRTPAIADGPAEIINNVVYNARDGFAHDNPASGEFNITGNRFRSGPNRLITPIYLNPQNQTLPAGYHFSQNFLDDPGTFTGRFDNPFGTNLGTSGSGLVNFGDWYPFYCCGVHSGLTAHSGPYDFDTSGGHQSVTSQVSAVGANLVYYRAGAYPKDAVASVVRTDLSLRTGHIGEHILDPSQWMTELPTPTAPLLDSDDDGMPDIWEAEQGLNPDVNDSALVRPSGYTAIEDYVNTVADSFYFAAETIFPNGFD